MIDLCMWELAGQSNPCRLAPSPPSAGAGACSHRPRLLVAYFGWDYLSNATCLMRPRLFDALFIVQGSS